MNKERPSWAGWICSAVLLILLAGAGYMVWQQVDEERIRLASDRAILTEKQRVNDALTATVKKLEGLLLVAPCALPEQVDGYVLAASAHRQVVAP